MQHLPRGRGRGRTHAALVLALVLRAVPQRGGEEEQWGAESEPARGADCVPSLPGEGASAAVKRLTSTAVGLMFTLRLINFFDVIAVIKSTERLHFSLRTYE